MEYSMVCGYMFKAIIRGWTNGIFKPFFRKGGKFILLFTFMRFPGMK